MQTLLELLIDYVQHLRALNFSGWTAKQANNDLREWIRWTGATLGVATPDQLRASHLERWLQHMSRFRTRKGLSLNPRTINKRIQEVRSFLKHLAQHGYVQTRLVEGIQYVREPKTLPGSVLNHEQVRRMLDGVPTDGAESFRNRTMLELVYSSGIRVAELLGLNLRDVDFTNRVARVRGKGQKERMVPIGQTALHFLEGYIKGVRPGLPMVDEEALFVTMSGERVKYSTFLKLVHTFAQKAGLEVNVTPHTFRRSCTTELLRAGAGMYHVKELLGHESLETLKHYAKLTITDLKETHRRCHPREKDATAMERAGDYLDGENGNE